MSLKSSIGDGEINLKSGKSSISVTDERVNILCPELFVNGLPFSNPDFENYYTINETHNLTSQFLDTIDEKIDEVLKSSLGSIVYPVGSIYMSVNDVDPSFLFSGTVWEKIEDTFLLGSGS